MKIQDINSSNMCSLQLRRTIEEVVGERVTVKVYPVGCPYGPNDHERLAGVAYVGEEDDESHKVWDEEDDELVWDDTVAMGSGWFELDEDQYLSEDEEKVQWNMVEEEASLDALHELTAMLKRAAIKKEAA